MGVTLTDVLLFGKAQSDDVDNATFVIYRRNILRWSALGGYLDIIVKGVSPISLPDAIADSLAYLKAFGGTELVPETYLDTVTAEGKCEQGLPDGYTAIEYVENTSGTYVALGVAYNDANSILSVTATAEMLLKVGNYEDVQEILSGVVTRNVGVKVLDGTENWTETSSEAPYVIVIPDMLGPSSADGETVWTMNSHFRVVARNPSWSQYSNLCSTNTLQNRVQFRYQDNQSTLADFKQFLADQYANGTPVIIVYPLATPTTESVAGQTMQVQQGDNVVEITQASMNNLELEAKYQAAVSLTIQEVQDANLDPNVQVTIN